MKKSNVFFSRTIIFVIFAIFPVLLFSQVEEWVARYNGTGNLDDLSFKNVVDSSGNIYVLGRSNNGTDYDFATVKYNNEGVQQWVAILDGIGNGNDQPFDIAVDSSENVYVIGRIYDGTGNIGAIVKYNAAGIQQWVMYPGFSLRAIDVDTAGFFYVAGIYWGGSSDDYYTVKYNGGGTQQWAQTYNGPADTWDYPEAITLDSAGNVFVTGIIGVGSGRDWGTIKYDNDGNQQWVATFNSSGNQWDWADYLAVDPSGNVYVTGTYNETSNGSDAYATVKYASNGSQVWARTYISGIEPYNSPLGMYVDEFGNVCVTGITHDGFESPGPDLNADFGTIKYDTDGNVLWDATYSSSGDNWDVAREAVIAEDESVYVTGYSMRTKRTNADITTIKYDSLGNEEWIVFYNGPGDGSDTAFDVSLDSSGNVIVTGESEGDGTGADFCTIKYVSAEVIIQKLEEAKEILENLDTSVFLKEQYKGNLIKRIERALNHIRNGRYQQAYNVLNTQILPQIDGCALRGTPDTGGFFKRDWIMDCTAQQELYPLIKEAAELLENSSIKS